MWRRIIPIIVYFIPFCILILITPPYGDPAIVLWTSKIMSKTGFPYDPVCSTTIDGIDLRLCVRSPMYYLLLAFSSEYYRVLLIIFVGVYFILQSKLANSTGLFLNVYAFMFPPIYLLFSRTYVDSLTVILLTILLFTLIEAEAKDNKQYRVLLFITPLLLMLTRESSITLPFLLLTILLIKRNLRDKNLLLVFLGWLTGFFIYWLYVSLSRGVSYSDFQPHIPSLLEVYRSVMISLTPVLPWEVNPEDLQAYLHLKIYTDWLMLIVVAGIHILAIMALIPIAFSSTRVNDLNKIIVGWLIFGFLISPGLLFLKGDIDFFRHLSYLIPVIPLLIEEGFIKIEKYSKAGAQFIKISYILLFALYFARTVRLYASGYVFDTCQYLLNRSEISSVEFFYETACS